MKYIVLFLMLTVGVKAIASESYSRGYLYETRNSLAYAGYSDDGTDVGFLVDYYLRAGNITEEQVAKMEACMMKKETHAILVTVKATPVSVPTGIPGRMTTVRTTKVSDVSCVKAPGYLALWRSRMN